MGALAQPPQQRNCFSVFFTIFRCRRTHVNRRGIFGTKAHLFFAKKGKNGRTNGRTGEMKRVITYIKEENIHITHIAKSLGHEAAETRAHVLRMADGRKAVAQADRQTTTISRKNCFPFTLRIYSFHLFLLSFASSLLCCCSAMMGMNRWKA